MRRLAGRAAAVMSLLALGVATGCNGFFVYPGSLNGSGSGSVLTELSGSPYQAGSAVDALAVTGTSLLAAAALGASSDLSLYSFDLTTAGKLDNAASTATGANEAGPVAVAAAGNYVYVANAGANNVSGYAISSTALTPVANSPYALPSVSNLASTPTSIAVNPANTLLYVGTNNGIYGFAIGQGGALIALNGGAVIGPVPVQSMDISPDGNWLLALDDNGLSIDQFQINPSGAAFTGALMPFSVTSYASSQVAPRAIKIAPSGEFVFIALGTAGDVVYTFNTSISSGALTNPLTLPAPASPMSDNALAVSPNSSTLYIARSNSASPGTVAAYSIGSGGSLTFAAQGTTGIQPNAVVVNAAGSDVYVANRSDGTISGFSTTATTP